MADAARPTPQAVLLPARRTWSLPILRELPKLSDLTLASAIGGTGGTGGSGSTVFGLLLAVGLVAGCASDQGTGPSETVTPQTIATITCHASLATQSLSCEAPMPGPGTELLGGQGKRVVLRSNNVTYVGGSKTFSFNASVQNLTAQMIGTTGPDTTGIKVFFVAPPAITAGTGAPITVMSGLWDNFTAPSQDYYEYATALAPMQISGDQLWELLVDPTVTAFTFTVLVIADVPTVGGILRWETIDGFDHQDLRSVAYTSPTDIVAVGLNGTTARWNAGTGSWDAVNATVPENLYRVVALGDGNYIAAGATGLWKLQGDIWSKVVTTTLAPVEIAVRDAGHFIATDGFQIIRWNAGSGYTVAFSPSIMPLSLVASGPGIDRVLDANGENWISIAGGPWIGAGFLWADSDPRTVLGMYYNAGGDLIFSFNAGLEQYGAVVRYPSDTLYSSTTSYPRTIIPTGATTILIGLDDFLDNTELVRVDYTGAHVVDSLFGGFVGVDGLGGFTSRIGRKDAGWNELFLVSSYGQLSTWDGSTLTATEEAVGAGTPTFANVGDTLFVGMTSGSMYRIFGSTPTGEFSGYPINGIAGYLGGGMAQLSAVSDWTIHERTGPAAWGIAWINPTAHPFRAIAADPATDLWLAVGNGGLVGTRVANVWSAIPVATSDNINAVWICPGTTTAYMVTNTGVILKYDNGVIDPDPEFYGGAGWGQSLNAISGSSCSDVWVAGESGAVWHWDGVIWDFVMTADVLGPAPTAWTAITVPGPGEAWVGRDQGEIEHLEFANPGIFASYRIPDISTPITAMSVRGGDLYVAAGAHLYRGIR